MRKFLKCCLQESLLLVLLMILIIFFCNVNTLFTIEEVPQKIRPYDIMEWMCAQYINFNVSFGTECFIWLTA